MGNQAFKIDRATLVNSEDGVEFRPRLDKITSLVVETPQAKLLTAMLQLPDARSVLCSNMIVESRRMFQSLNVKDSIARAAFSPGDAIGAIADMETYDFFAVCKSKKVTCHGAIRVISDVCGDTCASYTRALVSFRNGVDLVLQFARRASPASIDTLRSLHWRANLRDMIVTDFCDMMIDKTRKVFGDRQAGEDLF